MDGLFDLSGMDFMHNLIPDSWFDNALKGFALSDDEIAQSVHEANAFFHMDDPTLIQEYRTTGVDTGSPFTENDDIFYFNRQQMQNLGINDKESFDLVMTHECTHRMLQAVSNDLPAHKEELCCDYMSGVRSGLNHMDISRIKEALSEQPESASHPIGSLRVDAVVQGQHFAEQFMAENGYAPTFEDCYEKFCETFPDNHFIDDHDDNNIKEYTQSEIDRHVSKAESAMREAKSRMEYYANWIRRHGKNDILVDAERGLKNAERDYANAKADYNKWKYTHPDTKGFVDTSMLYENSGMTNGYSDALHEYSSDVAKADAEVNRCQRKVNSLYSDLQSTKSKYGTNSSEYKHVKNEYDKAQSALSEARDEYKKAVQYDHRRGQL